MAQWIYFELDEELPGFGCEEGSSGSPGSGEPSDCTKARAKVIDFWQGDEPPTPETNDTLYVWNRRKDDSDNLCLFSGADGDRGFACLDDTLSLYYVVAMGGQTSLLLGGCLKEDHPGRGEVFDLYLGYWDSDQNEWVYVEEWVVKAIDWRYAVPYPDAGTTGLFTPRPSTTYGTIFECVALDCVSPGACFEEYS